MLIPTAAADVLLKDLQRGGVGWDHCFVCCCVCISKGGENMTG